MRYLWRDTSYELPDHLVDHSVVMLVDESSSDARMSVTLAFDVLSSDSAAGLAAYVDEVIEEATARLHALRVDARNAVSMEGRDVVVVAQTASPEPGVSAHLAQAFVRERDAVTIVTVTTDEDQAARARASLDAVVRSMKRVAT